MRQVEDVYNSTIGDSSNSAISPTSEVPNLVDSGNGYVIYER